MAQEIKLEAAGLYTNPSDLQRPDGALSIADNIVINREGVIEPRRGFRKYVSSEVLAPAPPGTTLYAYLLVPYKDGLVFLGEFSDTIYLGVTNSSLSANTGTASIAHTLEGANLGYWCTQFAGNLYIPTSAGVQKLTSLSGASKATAGIRQPPGEYVYDRYRVINAAVGQMSLTSNIVTVNSTAAHGLNIGDLIFQTSATEAPYTKGYYTVLTVPSATQFTYALTAGDDAGNANAHTFKIPTYDTTQGWLAREGEQVAYRYVFVKTDANGNEIVSPPSPRIYFPSSGVDDFTASVADKLAPILKLFYPPQFTADETTRIKLYRTKATPTTVEPNDEMGLVLDRKLEDTELTQGIVTVKDITPDALRGEALYTNPSQEGILQSNDNPPIMYEGSCIVNDGLRLLFSGEITERPTFIFSLLAVGGTRGLQNDTELFELRIKGVTGTPANNNEFKIQTTGTDAQNIRATALDICSAINSDQADFTAYYISGANEAPGRIAIVSYNPQGFDEAIATTTKVQHEAFFPAFGAQEKTFSLSRTSNIVTATVTTGTHSFRVNDEIYFDAAPGAGFTAGPHRVRTVNSAQTTLTYLDPGAQPTANNSIIKDYKTPKTSNTRHYARIYESKLFEPEHVPALNYADIGDTTKRVWAMAVVRNQVFAFKEDGLFIRTAPLTWELFDETVRVVAPRTVVTLLNNVYAWTTQGIVAINDTGVEIISRPIEKTLSDIFLKYPSAIKERAFAVANELERTLYVFAPDLTLGGYPSQAFVYNTITRIWTRQTVFDGATQRAFYSGVIGFDEYAKPHLALITAENAAGSIYIQRNTYTNADYQDISGAAKTADQGISADAAFFSADPSFSPGDTVLTNLGTTHVVSIVLVDNAIYEVYFTTADVPALATTFAVTTALNSTWQYAPITGQNPDQLKLFRQANVLFQNGHAREMTAAFSTELKTTFESQTVDLQSIVGQWGPTWDGTERPFNLSLLLPQEMRRATRLNAKFTFNKPVQAFAVNGLSIRLSPSGDKVSK